MPTIADLVNEVKTLHHELTNRVEMLDKEQKKLGEALTSKSGQLPAEYKDSINELNGRIDTLMVMIKEADLERKRPKSFLEKGGSSDGFKAFRKALKAGVAHLTAELTADELKHVYYPAMPAEQKAMYESDATTGGFFANIDFVNKLIQYIILISPVRSIAQVIQTKGSKVEYPNLLADTTAYWATEQSSFTYSGDPTLGMLEIVAQEMRGLVQISEQNLEDSQFDLETFLLKRLSKKFAQKEGTAFVNGTGIGQPRGFMNYAPFQAYNASATPTGKQTGLTYIPYIPSGQAAALTPDCFTTAQYDLKQDYEPNARWCMTRQTLGIVRLFKDNQNRPLWIPFGGPDLPGTINGVPYITVPDMPEVGANAYPVALGDFSEGYIIADRIGLNIKQLDELYAPQGLRGYIARMRVGGDVILPEAFRVIKVATS